MSAADPTRPADLPEDEDLFDFNEVERTREELRRDSGSRLQASSTAFQQTLERADSDDPDLDLFEFGVLFEASRKLARESAVEDSERDVGKRKEQESRVPSLPTSRGTQATAEAAAPETVSRTGVMHRAGGLARATFVRARRRVRKQRLSWELAAAALLLMNLFLVLSVWRSNVSLRSTLERSLSQAAPREDSTQDSNDAPSVLPTQPEAEPSSISEATPAEDVLPELDRVHLDLAAERMAAGRHAEARRALYHVLANRDRMDLSRTRVAETEVAIARTFDVQGLESEERDH